MSVFLLPCSAVNFDGAGSLVDSLLSLLVPKMMNANDS